MFNSNNGLRILVVDDEPEILRTLKRILARKGYDVVTFEDPFKALDHLKTDRVHLILTDLKMPEMDGVQLLLRIKQHYPAIPVVLITAYATISTAVTAMQQGAFDYLRKPFDIKRIYEVVESALDSLKCGKN